MARHANLSPSAAERWIACPASVRVEATYPNSPDSVYAAEGTKAHALGELEAALAFGLITERQYTGRYAKWLMTEPVLLDEDLLDMQRHIAAYVALIAERAALFPHTQVLLEQKVSTGIEQCWGTADAVLVSPGHVEVIDLKYGMGIPVSAWGNPQLRLYGVGALEMFGDVLGDTEVVRVTVFQPRLDSTSTEELSATELRAWRDALIPLAAEALWSNKARFGPGEVACRWCAAAGECRARMEYMTQEDFGRKPDLLTVEELSELLDKVPGIRSWCEAVADTALRKAYSEGVAIPGWKVVMSNGNRVVTDQPAAIETFVELGFKTEEVVTTKLKGIGDLEKLIKAATLGPKRDATLESVLGDLVGKTPGKPALAHEGDARPAIAPNTEAQKDFDQPVTPQPDTQGELI